MTPTRRATELRRGSAAAATSGIDEPGRTFGSAEAAKIEAFEAAREALARGEPQGEEAIRRIARSLRVVAAEAAGAGEIASAAAKVEAADRESLPETLSSLLDLLRAAIPYQDAPRIRILVVDDDRDLLRLLEAILQTPDREVLAVGTLADAERVLEQNDVGLVLLDLQLATGDGRDLLVRMRENPRTATTPVIVMSAHAGIQPKTECFALGADDFFAKPLDVATVAATVAARLHREAETSRRVRRDLLTGLPNRFAFEEEYERARVVASVSHRPLSLAMVDLDRFKSINDSHGHTAGDVCLRRAAAILSEKLHKHDFVARWGGEEFVALFPATDEAGASIALRRALDVLRGERILAPDGREIRITFSAGVSGVAAGLTVDEAVAKADRVLYLAKSQGRNRVVCENDTVALPRPRAIVVSADEALVSDVGERLREEGFEVDRSSTFAEIAAAKPSTLIVIDARISSPASLALRAIRSQPASSKTPILALTSGADEAELLAAFELGADDCLAIPRLPDELSARVRHLARKP